MKITYDSHGGQVPFVTSVSPVQFAIDVSEQVNTKIAKRQLTITDIIPFDEIVDYLDLPEKRVRQLLEDNLIKTCPHDYIIIEWPYYAGNDKRAMGAY